MKIAIEALGIHYPGGGRTATMNLLEPLFAINSTNQYQVFLTQTEPSLFSKHANIKQTVIPFKNRFLVRFWAQLSLPFLTQRIRPGSLRQEPGDFRHSDEDPRNGLRSDHLDPP